MTKDKVWTIDDGVKPNEIVLVLDELDFDCLVRGGEIHCGNLRIALQDIGFLRMKEAIASAECGIDIFMGHIKK